MPTIEQSWGTTAALTITLASLGSDTAFLAGRQSTAFDFTGVDCTDALIEGVITTGTSPTDAREIRVYAVASMDGSTWRDAFGGSDSARSVTSSQIRDALCRIAAAIATDNSSDRPYPFAPVSVIDLFGSLPRKVVVWVVHNTGVALNGTGSNHAITITPIYHTSA